MTTLLGTLLGLVIVVILNALVIYIVGRLGLGMTVAGFGAAIITALVIGVVSWLVNWLIGLLGFTFLNNPGLIGAIIALIISAIVLMISDRFVAGMKVDGFGGAIIAAIAIGVVYWVVAWLVNLIL